MSRGRAQQLPVAEQEARAWSVAQSLGTWTGYVLAEEAQVQLDIVRSLVLAWRREGMVSFVGIGKRRRHLYTVVANPRPLERPASSPTEAMWRTARVLDRFSPVDLVMHASTEAQPVNDQDARRFCAMLLRGGYVRVLRRAALGRHPALYLLIRDTGPRPPEERRVRAIWDPNERRYAHVQDPEQ